MRIAILLFMGFSSACFAQGKVEPCEIAMVNAPLPTSLAAVSSNGKYLVRIEPGSGDGSVVMTAGLFKWDGNSYLRKVALAVDDKAYPLRVFISDSGNVATIGKWKGATNIEELILYSVKGDVIKNIESIHTDSLDTSENCRLMKPWICWTHPFEVSHGDLLVRDLDGAEITIDLKTGKYEKSKKLAVCD